MFKERSHLDTYKKEVHVVANKRRSICKNCDLMFRNKDALYMHDKTVHRLSQYICDECREKFKTANITDRTHIHS